MPLPLNGPQRKVLCAHCLEDNYRTDEFWGELADVVDCYPRTRDFDDHDINVAVTAPRSGDGVDAPVWLRDLAPAVRRLYSAVKEGNGDVEGLEVTGVSIKCPVCSGGLNLTGESRKVNCDYCKREVFIPDDIWRRLHPVKKAEPWFIEYEGPNALERRRAPSLRTWSAASKHSIFDEEKLQKIPHKELKVMLDQLYRARVELRKELQRVMGVGWALLLSVVFGGFLALVYHLTLEGPEFAISATILGPVVGVLLFLVLVVRSTLKKRRNGRLKTSLADLNQQISAIKARIAAGP
jgi:hypothetical protein